MSARSPIVRSAIIGLSLVIAAVFSRSNPIGAAPAAAGRMPPATAPPVSIKSFVDSYCIGCHNERLKTADLVLEHRDVTAIGKDAAIWEKVVTKLHAGAMPPPGSKRPDPATYQAFISTVEEALDRAAAGAPNSGRPPIHRLNRLEYTNAVRDLFDLEIDGKAMLPADDSGFGFETSPTCCRSRRACSS